MVVFSVLFTARTGRLPDPIARVVFRCPVSR
jgi:hypothetical protein